VDRGKVPHCPRIGTNFTQALKAAQDNPDLLKEVLTLIREAMNL
jgi:hypothetical protein